MELLEFGTRLPVQESCAAEFLEVGQCRGPQSTGCCERSAP